MRNLYLIISLLFCGFTTFAQSRNNHWLLGLTDVNFSTNPPVANTVAGGGYGIATVSSSNGTLLFYTDGVTVWNKNHQVMLNGNSIDGSSELTTSLQRVIIVPNPGNSNQYYIIRDVVVCTAGAGNGSCWGHYFYSIVDFTSNSLGQVISLPGSVNGDDNENTYSRALRLADGSSLTHKHYYSPLTFTADITGNNYWVIVQDYNNLISYKVDSQGLSSTPVISIFSSNQIYNGPTGTQNYDGKFIQRSMFRVTPAYGSAKLYGLESSKEYFTGDTDPANHKSHFYSVDFNMSTGQFSGFQDIALQSYGIPYNFEISPDLTKAYLISYFSPNMTGGNDGQIIVKDLSNLSVPSRTLYEFTNSTVSSAKFLNIQKDKYGNMFVTGKSADLNRNKYFHVINNPNSFSNSTIKINYLSLNNNTAGVLPQLFPKLECIGSLVLSNVQTSNKTYKVSDAITTNSAFTVNSGINTTLKAGYAVYFEPNTDIKAGAILIAEIEQCIDNSSTDRVGVFNESDNIEPEMVTQNGLIIYPNPSTDVTTFRLNDGLIKTITIYSVDGRLVLQKNIMQNSFDLDISSFVNGVYITTVTASDGSSFTQKVIKK